MEIAVRNLGIFLFGEELRDERDMIDDSSREKYCKDYRYCLTRVAGVLQLFEEESQLIIRLE